MTLSVIRYFVSSTLSIVLLDRISSLNYPLSKTLINFCSFFSFIGLKLLKKSRKSKKNNTEVKVFIMALDRFTQAYKKSYP